MLITAAVFALTLVEPVCEPHLRICATAETHAFDVCTEPAVLVAEFGPSADQATRSQPAAPDQDKNEKQRDSQKGEAKKSEEKPPTPEHTGLETLVTDILSDFKALPRRESTWVILGVGGAAALAVHPADRSVNSHLLSSGSADKLWKPGHIIGGPIMYGVPVALYLGGRYLLAPAKDEPQTNKWSHLGLDLIRAELEEEAIVQTLKFS